MKRDKINYLAVGTFVIVMVGAFFVLMYFVTGRTGPADHYVVRYKNVTGLKFGTGVFYEGYHVGQIEKIVPESVPSGIKYVLTVGIVRGWTIPEDSVARIVSSGLISAVHIDIDGGKSANSIPPGSEIKGRERQDLFAMLNEAARGFYSLSEDGVIPVLENLNHRINEVSDEIINFRRNDLKPLVENINKRLNNDLIGDAQALVAKLDYSAQQLGTILGGENQQRIEQFLVHIGAAATSLNELISRIESTRVQMGETLVMLEDLAMDNSDEIAGAIHDASVSMREMRKALTTVNEHISTIMYNVEGSTRQLHEFAQAVRDNPARLMRGSRAHDKAE